MKKLAIALLAAAGVFGLVGCTETDATVGSQNLATAAEQFEIPRYIVGVNNITDKLLFEVVGYCSITDQATQLEVICKDQDGSLRKIMLGKGDNTSYVVRDLESTNVSTKHIRVIVKPETLLPEFNRP